MAAAMALTTDVLQSAILTRQTIQSIEILEYTTDELSSFLQDAAMRNPLIKLSLPRIHTAPPPQSRAPALGASIIDYTAEPPAPFREDLRRQLTYMRLSPSEFALASHLIEALEDDGYLRADMEIMADILQTNPSALEAALTHIHKLEPTGVGARNLRECLLLQLHEQGPVCPKVQCFLDNFDLLLQGKTDRLAKLCNISPSELPALVGQVRKLSPRPNVTLSREAVQPALPDILVSALEDGGLGVELNPALLPKVLIDNEYYVEISASLRERNDRHYLRSCLQEANLLVRNLAQRAETGLMVASWIVKVQADFFTHGPKALKPLSQKEISRLAGVHESTVSRAVSNRNLLCDQGLFSLKYFFSDGLAATSQGTPSMAASALREKIKHSIRNETAATVLSDDDLVDIFAADGIAVARRTIAKYRSQLNIASSAARRRNLRLDLKMA